MNSDEGEFINMLEIFQSTDLQELLRSFGINIVGQHFELKKQALLLLRYNTIGLNYQDYLAKIIEIYDRNQRQQTVTMTMEQARPSRPPPPPYPHNLTHIPQVGYSQVMPSFQTGIYANNIQYSYLPDVPCNIVPQASQHSQANQQLHTITPNTVVADNSSYCNLNYANSSIPSPLHHVQFKKLPFYENKTQIIKPTTLIGHFQCTLSNCPEGMKETEFKFTLSPEQATDIGMNRDISNKKNDYVYQLQIRISLYEPSCLEMIDYLPIGLHIRFNKNVCPLPPVIHKSQSEIETRRKALPIDCSGLVKLNPSFTNSVLINWIPDANYDYVMAMYLVKKLTPENLLQKLIDKRPRSSEETKNYIREKLENLDPDLTTTSYRVSLVCPLGKNRVKIPAKSTNCDHLQCFDARTFILMNEKNPTWTCPTCNQPCLYDDIQIESFFLEIVSNVNIPDNCKEIELFADGTWKLFEENKEPLKIVADVEVKHIDSIILNDSDDEYFMEIREQNHNPMSQKEHRNMRSNFNLAVSMDEELKKKKDKPENEAQTDDVGLPVTVASYYSEFNPLVPVQPQIVTSSVQEENYFC